MSSNAVGWMSFDLNYDLLREEVVKLGMSMFKVRYMKDNMVLLTPKEGMRMEDIVKLNKDWFVSVFEDVESSSESYVASHKLVWVRCYGLPLSLCNKDCFPKVVGEVASLVAVDEATTMWENLEYARIQVRVLKSCKAEMSKAFRINGKVYNICLVEKDPRQGGGACKCSAYQYTSSDSVSSSESFVEETIFSARSSEEGGENGGADGVLRWDEEAKVGDKDGEPLQTKSNLMEECFLRNTACQRKIGSPDPFLALCEEASSDGGATLAVMQ